MCKKPIAKKAQAIAEIAVMGMLVLIIFGTIISVGQRFDKMQETKMRAFRKALNASYIRNAPVSYTLREDSRGLDFSGFGKGGPLSSGGYASVMWQKGAPGTTLEGDDQVKGSYAFYEVNGKYIGAVQGWDAAESSKESPTTTDSHGNTIPNPLYSEIKPSLWRIRRQVFDQNNDQQPDTVTPVGIWKEDTRRFSDYNATSVRDEQGSLITNQDAAINNESVKSKIYVRGDWSKIEYHEPGPVEQLPIYDPNSSDVENGYDYAKGKTETTFNPTTDAQASMNMRAKKVQVTRMDGTKRTDIRMTPCTTDPNDPGYDPDNPSCSAVVPARRNWQTPQ